MGTVSGVVPLGGRESLELSNRSLPESQGVASNFRTTCQPSEVGGDRSPSLIVDSIKPLHMSDTHPCTSTDDKQAFFAPLPAVIPGETYRITETQDNATSECGVDEEAWALGDTGFGWGVPVMPGFATLEVKNADPCMGHVLNGGGDSPYVGAYLV